MKINKIEYVLVFSVSGREAASYKSDNCIETPLVGEVVVLSDLDNLAEGEVTKVIKSFTTDADGLLTIVTNVFLQEEKANAPGPQSQDNALDHVCTPINMETTV